MKNPQNWKLAEARRLAEAVLCGDVAILEAAPQLSSALMDTDLYKTDAWACFAGVASETDDLPIGTVRQYWASEALIEKDRVAAAYEAKIRKQFLAACDQILKLIPETN